METLKFAKTLHKLECAEDMERCFLDDRRPPVYVDPWGKGGSFGQREIYLKKAKILIDIFKD